MWNFVSTKQHLRETLLFCFNLKKSVAEGHRLLCEAYGKHAPSIKICEYWLRCFKSDKMLMLCIWWDQFIVVYYEVLQPNETITAERYQQQLMQLSRALKFKRPQYAKRHDGKITFSTTTLGHTLLKSSRKVWKHLTGMSYPTRRIRQTLLLRITTCSGRWLMAWLSSTSLLMKKPKIGSILGSIYCHIG